MSSNSNRSKTLVAALSVVSLLALASWPPPGRAAPLNDMADTSKHPPTLCNDFSGTTDTTPYPHMVWVPGGKFVMGDDDKYPEESPAFKTHVDGFWMDVHEVTNAQFQQFVEETGYVTLAESGTDASGVPKEQQVPGSAVFVPFLKDGSLNSVADSWWRFVPGANWRHPEGPGSNIEGRENHPAVHIAFQDAQAYAKWAGKELPTEAQFEFAAKDTTARDMEGHYQANTWQGFFPFNNNGNDGYVGSSPVGCFKANEYGIYDLIGNVWEWTSSPYYDTHDFPDKKDYPEGYDPRQPNDAVAVIKGGSFLCAPNYCRRYRPEARQGQSKGLGTSNVGFRLVVNKLNAE